jgi:competence protein ComEC
MPEPYGHPGIHGTSWALALCALGLLLPPWPRAARLRVLCAALLVAGAHLPLLHRARASWVTLDVGQGDAAVYRAGSRTLVVDAGPRARDYDAGRWVVLPYLARRNLRGVDLLLTHGHLDHFGGARALLGSGRVARVLVAACDSSRDWVADLRDRCAEQGARLAYLTRGDTLRYRPWPLPCLWPDAEAGWRSANSRSLVLAVGAPRARLLATGDLERDAERELLRVSPTLLGNVAVLKVGHHGGNTGTDAAWLRAMEPHPVALISCGRNNRYHHPHPEVLARLRGVEARTLRTDVSGAIEIFWDPRGRPSWRSAR